MKEERSIVLSNNCLLPKVGFGTWTYNDDTVQDPLRSALSLGYRLIDSAEYYGNEKGIGIVLKDERRTKFFVTSKVWVTNYGYNKTLSAFQETKQRLGLDYLDLYLIHWPATENKFSNWRELNSETWRALEDLYFQGEIRAIGVSNFNQKYINQLFETARVKPMLNQIEFHPGFVQKEIIDYCKKENITIQAWSPFGRGEAFENLLLNEIAKKKQKTVAQVCLRWILQHNIYPVVKASSLVRQEENLKVFDFVLTQQEMVEIDSIPFFGKLGYNIETKRF